MPSFFHDVLKEQWSALIWAGIVLALIYVSLARTVYLLYLHPLSKFPGPKSWALTRWFVSLSIMGGRSHDEILALHDTYGPIVRVAPDELSIQSVSAWHDIGGHRKPGQLEMGKEPVFNEAFKDNLLGVTAREDHGRMRRILSRGFSASTLAKQEALIKIYIDRLLVEFKDRCKGGKQALDVEPWFSFAAFDIIGDLTFGESFGSLEEGGHSHWASLIFDTTRFVIMANCLKRINKALLPALAFFAPRGLARRVRESDSLRDAKIAKRCTLGATRPDYMSAMLGDDGKGLKLSPAEISSNCTALILGGSETISTALSTATYYLAVNPPVMAKLAQEVRTSFQSEDEIDLTRSGQLKYLQAVISETLRILPPFAGASPRVVPEGGATIAGQDIPAGTVVGIWHWSMSRSSQFFRSPDEFHPERWLESPDHRFQNDQKQAAQPFAVGPRNCIGMNLAYVELRLVLARMLWNFDFAIDPVSKTWASDLIEYFGWEKQPLMVYLTPRA